MGAAAVPILAAVIGTASAGAQVYQSRSVAKDAKREGEKAAAEAGRMRRDQEAREAASAGEFARSQARRRQRALGAEGTSRSTILTGPLGIPGEPSLGRKTLLGL
jgi:hypothetical protein